MANFSRRQINALLTDFSQDINITNETKILMTATLKRVDESHLLSYKEGLIKLRKIGNKEKIMDYILLSTSVDFVNDYKEMKQKEVGLVNYHITNFKEKSLEKAINVALTSTTLLSPFTLGITGAIGGLAIGTAILASKLINETWGIANTDLKFIDKKIKANNDKENNSLERLVQNSKYIPDNIKKATLEDKKEYLTAIINNFRQSDRHYKRLLKTTSFDEIVGIFEFSQKIAKQHNVDIKISEYADLNKYNKLVDKDLYSVTNFALLKHIKSNEEAQKQILKKANQLDDKDVESFKECVSKNIEFIRKHFKDSAIIAKFHDNLSSSLIQMSAKNGVNMKKEDLELVTKLYFENFVEYRDKGVDIVFNNITKPTISTINDNIISPVNKILQENVISPAELYLSSHGIDFKSEDLISSSKMDFNKFNDFLFKGLSEEQQKDITDSIEELNFLDPKTFTKKRLENIIDAYKENKFMNRKLSIKLKENGWENNWFGKKGLVLLEGLEKFYDKSINYISQKLSTKTNNDIKYWVSFIPQTGRDVIKAVDDFISFPSTVFADKIPRGIGNFINYLSKAGEEIKRYDSKIDVKESGVSFTSILSKKIKEMGNKNEQDIVQNLKNLKNKYSTP